MSRPLPAATGSAGWSPAVYARVRWWLLVVGDLLIAAAAYRMAFWLRSHVYIPIFRGLLPMERWPELPHLIWLVVASQFVWLHVGGVYDDTDVRRGVFPRLLQAVLIHVLFLMSYHYATRTFGFPRSVFFSYFVLDLLMLIAWHAVVTRAVRSRRPVRLLVVGRSRQAEEFVGRARAGALANLELVGVVDPGPAPVAAGEELAGCPVLGARDDLPRLVREQRVEEVLLIPGEAWQDELLDALSRESSASTRLLVAPSAYETIIGRLEFLNLEDLLTLEIARRPASTSMQAAKRVADAVLALGLLVVLSPLFVLAALLTKLQDGGPVFFAQERVGERMRPFRILKFRSMRPDAESQTGPVLATERDPRVTRWGRFMRSTRIDELPQLLNVIAGQMSFVGPRPERPEFVRQFLAKLKCYGERFQVRPGMTGLAQIHGRYLSTAENKLRYDLAYVYHQSMWLDIVILLQTLRVVLSRKGT
jgi:exopolysaccharide biosynthesis polyprenyl glycosylphosphotransferase